MTRSDTTPAKQRIVSATRNSGSRVTWKNRLRDACLSRARHRKRSIQECEDSVSLDPRKLVESELMMHGVRVVSPPEKRQAREQPAVEPMDFEMTEDEIDEIIALIEEIERDEKEERSQWLLEEEISRMQGEEQALMESIAEYERWNAAVLANDVDPEAVLCPLCQEEDLILSNRSELGNGIVCPNNMDGTCPFSLEARPGLSLPVLKERLAAVICEHGSHCSHHISFEVINEASASFEPTSRLWAICSVCDGRVCLA